MVISSPDTREGNTEADESGIPDVTKWWQDNVGSQDEQVYTRNIIDRFDKDDSMKLLIVVDKLLTGLMNPKMQYFTSISRLKGITLFRQLPALTAFIPRRNLVC